MLKLENITYISRVHVCTCNRNNTKKAVYNIFLNLQGNRSSHAYQFHNYLCNNFRIYSQKIQKNGFIRNKSKQFDNFSLNFLKFHVELLHFS